MFMSQYWKKKQIFLLLLEFICHFVSSYDMVRVHFQFPCDCKPCVSPIMDLPDAQPLGCSIQGCSAPFDGTLAPNPVFVFHPKTFATVHEIKLGSIPEISKNFNTLCLDCHTLNKWSSWIYNHWKSNWYTSWVCLVCEKPEMRPSAKCDFFQMCTFHCISSWNYLRWS